MCGSGLPGHAAENDLDLLAPGLCTGEQRPRGAADPKCVVTRGNVAAAPLCSGAWENVSFPHGGGGVLFCFSFFFFFLKSLNHIGFLKNAAPGQGTTSGRPEQADPGEGPTFRRTPRERQAARGSRPRPPCPTERDTTPDFSGRGTAVTEAPLPFLEGRQAGTGPAGGSRPSLHPAEPTSAAKPPPRHWTWAAVAPGPRSPSGASAALLRPRLSTRPCRSRPEATALAPSLRLP